MDNSNSHSSSIISFASFSVPKDVSIPSMQGRLSSLGTSAAKEKGKHKSVESKFNWFSSIYMRTKNHMLAPRAVAVKR